MSGAGAALSAFYVAKIAAVRSSVTGPDRDAVLRAVYDEQRDAFRALAIRKEASMLAARERREIERHGDREAMRKARAPPPPS